NEDNTIDTRKLIASRLEQEGAGDEMARLKLEKLQKDIDYRDAQIEGLRRELDIKERETVPIDVHRKALAARAKLFYRIARRNFTTALPQFTDRAGAKEMYDLLCALFSGICRDTWGVSVDAEGALEVHDRLIAQQDREYTWGIDKLPFIPKNEELEDYCWGDGGYVRPEPSPLPVDFPEEMDRIAEHVAPHFCNLNVPQAVEALKELGRAIQEAYQEGAKEK
ncbi:MAG: hypothetical protein ACOC41_08915, partial [Chitinivibrionales bacterium]